MIRKSEANGGIKADRTSSILGVEVSGTSKEGLLEKIRIIVTNNAFAKPFFIITAYSENIIECGRDKQLAVSFSKANLIVADGVSVIAAREYLKEKTGDWWQDLWRGFEIGGKILRGEYADKRVLGVKLTEELLKLAGTGCWKVFLLGGKYGGVEKLAKKYGNTVSYYEPPMEMKIEDNPETGIILKKINSFKPDILLVGLGRFKQEKWIANNLSKLKAKVVMGVGSSFDELAGIDAWATTIAPEWVDRMGLKWLWRATKDPRHIRRAWNAFPVFAWKIYQSK